jgi:flagellar biosynthetic protein FlhB
MAEQSGGDKTLPASPRKRQKARERGSVARSQDLTAAILLLVALAAIRYCGPWTSESITQAARHYFGEFYKITVTTGNVREVAFDVVWRLGVALLPLMGVMLVAGVIVNLAQVGLLFSTQAIAFKFDRLNPLMGLSRFFSIRMAAELLKSLLKMVLAGWIVYTALDDRWQQVLMLMHMPPAQAVGALWTLIAAVWWRIALAMLVLGILDYGFQKWQYEKDLMMTQKEAREEAKEMDGDPRIKQRIRQIQRQMAMQRMMKDVPTADVIITNPTHYAVALKYDPNTMAAPILVAKGARIIAQRIRHIAVENNVPIVERPELARALHKAVEIGRPVPENLFRAVAEVLAFVYRIDRREEKRRERGLAAKPARRAV